jgi:rare lipoprotein A
MNTLAVMCVAAFSSLFSHKTMNWFLPTTGGNCLSYPAIATTDQNFLKKVFPRAIDLKLKYIDGWTIWVNKQQILTASSPIEAAFMITKLNLLLRRFDLDPSKIVPAYASGRYLARLGTETLFVLPSRELENPTLTLTQWVNNLRVALGGEPLTMIEAQEKMFRLVTTERSIEGMASWYGPYFNGRQTASGEQFQQEDFTAAHQSLPFDTYLKVTNLQNGNSVVVRINDRGPYVGERMLDLSYAAALQIDSEHNGVVPIKATVMLRN